MEFGELKDVNLREVWPHEAHNFTPWLVNNLERLSEVVGVPLESGDTEVAVGQFSADILARNTRDSSPVLIENQYGSTDHDHLGKILTYLAGLEARTIIWISERFNDAHLSAVRWLNENTTDPFSFFAVRLRVLQIADSPMVPVFEVLERPSDWDRRIRASAREDDSRLSETRQFRHDFWHFYAQRHTNDVELRPDHVDSNIYHEVSGLVISQHLSRNRVGIYIRPRTGDASEQSASRVENYREMLNNVRGEDCLYTNTHDRENWPEMADWLHDRLIEYQRVLAGDSETDG
jgi:hypothetical protein